MHVAAVMLFEGPPPPYDELLEVFERRLPLVPRYRQRLAFVPLGPGPPELGRRPAPEPALPRALDRAALARLRASSCRTWPAACSPSSSTATSRSGRSGSSRGSRTTASRCSRRPTTRWSTASRASTSCRCCSTARPSRSTPTGPGDRWLPRPLPSARPAARRGAARARHDPDRDGRAPCAPCSAGRAACSRPLARPPSASARWPGRASTPRRPVPYNAPIGPHRRFTWVRASLRDIKAIKDSLGGTVNDVVLATVAGALGRHLRRRGQQHRRPRAEGDGPGERAPGRRARRARQPGRGDDGAAAGLVPGAGRAARHRARGAEAT